MTAGLAHEKHARPTGAFERVVAAIAAQPESLARFRTLGSAAALAWLEEGADPSVRAAFADLLRGQGQPAPVILDDALVYSDGERFDAMLRLLQKAAQHTQILVLTCRERDYQLLGAPLIRLAACVDRAA